MDGAILWSRTKLIALVLPVAFTIGFINSWSAAAGILLIVLGVPALGLIFATGLVAALVQDVRADEPRRSRLRRAAATMLIAGLATALFLPAGWSGGYTGLIVRPAINARTYPAIIAELRSHPDRVETIERRHGVRLNVDRGPPLRVAFNPEGMLDNWSGIVFDPTGEMMQADGFDAQGRFRAPDQITKLFGGDLMSCRRLWADYYACSFT